jgi:outer membrane lipoprotein carrier protein
MITKNQIKIMRKVLIAISLLMSLVSFAQSDKKAEELLKKIVDKVAAYKNFKAELSYTMVNKEMDINEKKTGVIYVQGDKYRIEMEGQIIISDSKTIWTYILDSQEVMVSNVDKDDESISPNKILTTYSEDYKAKFDNDNKYKNSELKLIDLKANEKKQFEQMSILVNEKNLSLDNFSVYDKNGNVFTYNIINLKPNLDLSPDIFTFDPSKYPKVDVIDMR